MDFQLVASDMDGTLLDRQGQIPAGFWPILNQLHQRDISFVAASGRQLATLQQQFTETTVPISYIAENGTLVVHEGETVSLTPMDEQSVHDIIDAISRSDQQLNAIVCRSDQAFIEQSHQEFLAQCRPYYLKLDAQKDLHKVVNDQVIKVAVYSLGSSDEVSRPLLEDAAPNQQVVVSGEHWVDVLNPAANKGSALAQLREALGINREQVLAFGDYLNDLELLEQAGTSYAMKNAHPRIVAAADRIAPSNEDEGVLTVLGELLTR